MENRVTVGLLEEEEKGVMRDLREVQAGEGLLVTVEQRDFKEIRELLDLTIAYKDPKA